MCNRRGWWYVTSVFGFILVGLIHFPDSSSCQGEIPDLVTDRPDQTESSVVVPPGYFQLEMGWTHSENDDDGEDFESDTLPEALLRIGISPGWELRLGAPVHNWEDIDFDDGSPSSDEEGWGDMDVGVKKYLWAECGMCPEAAILAHLSIPTGEGGFSSERADPSFRLSLSHTLSDRLSVGYNLGAAWETVEDSLGDRDTGSVFQYTTAVGYSVTDRLGMYVELFGDIPMSADGTPANSFNGGFTYLVSDNFQLDVLSGVGLSDAADDWFVGAGVSYRWPR